MILLDAYSSHAASLKSHEFVCYLGGDDEIYYGNKLQNSAFKLPCYLKKENPAIRHSILMQLHAWLICTWSLKLIGADLSEPQYSQEWYVHQVHENLLNKNSLPHTVAESHTHVPFAKVYWKNKVCPTLLLNGAYVASTKFYLSKQSATRGDVCCNVLTRGWHLNVRSTPIFVLGQGARSS